MSSKKRLTVYVDDETSDELSLTKENLTAMPWFPPRLSDNGYFNILLTLGLTEIRRQIEVLDDVAANLDLI